LKRILIHERLSSLKVWVSPSIPPLATEDSRFRHGGTSPIFCEDGRDRTAGVRKGSKDWWSGSSAAVEGESERVESVGNLSTFSKFSPSAVDQTGHLYRISTV
jgi:hypothetical protein